MQVASLWRYLWVEHAKGGEVLKSATQEPALPTRVSYPPLPYRVFGQMAANKCLPRLDQQADLAHCIMHHELRACHQHEREKQQ